MCFVKYTLLVTLLTILIVTTYFMKILESASLKFKSFDLESVADYVDSVPYWHKGSDIRGNFKKRKIQKEKLKDLERLVSNTDSIYVDGISHYHPLTIKALNFEHDFIKLLAMDTMKYMYKRGQSWRTWRKAQDTTGKKKIICYRCHSPLLPNKTECAEGAFWEIEDTPPCPYEIESVIDDFTLCATNNYNFDQFNETHMNCPLKISYMDLTRGCNNPIITLWKFSRNYKVPERNFSFLCNEREFCEFSTLYEIQPEQVIFRIINYTQVMYSRVMRHDKKNYACEQNCGKIDLRTYKVTQQGEEKVFLNLLPPKDKRENKEFPVNRSTKSSNKIKKTTPQKSTLETFKTNQNINNIYSEINHNPNINYIIEAVMPELSTRSQCKKIIEDTILYDDNLGNSNDYQD